MKLTPVINVVILKVFPPNIGAKSHILTPACNFMPNIDQIIGFLEQRDFQKMMKLAENCNHNIDPQSAFTIGYALSAPLLAKMKRRAQFMLSGSIMVVSYAVLGICLYLEVYWHEQ
jgi:hypothetical protein